MGTRSRITPEVAQDAPAQAVVEPLAPEGDVETSLACPRFPLMAKGIVLTCLHGSSRTLEPLQRAAIHQCPEGAEAVRLEAIGVQGKREGLRNNPLSQRGFAEPDLPFR